MARTTAVIERVLRLAQGSAGEICGALLADDTGICDVVPLDNRSPRPASRFFIPAADVLRVERAAEQNGQRLAGFYHSHPNGRAIPSADDLDLAVPGYLYWIAAQDEIRAWRLRADRSGFDEVAVS